MVLVVEAWSSSCTISEASAGPREDSPISCELSCLILGRTECHVDVLFRLRIFLNAVIGNLLDGFWMGYDESRGHPHLCIPENQPCITLRPKTANADAVNIQHSIVACHKDHVYPHGILKDVERIGHGRDLQLLDISIVWQTTISKGIVINRIIG